MKDRFTEMLRARVVRQTVKLSSGATAGVYVDLRPLILQGSVSEILDHLMMQTPGASTRMSIVAGPVLAGAVLAAQMVASSRADFALAVRGRPKDHGLASRVEGPDLANGQRVWLVDDVATSYGSLLRTAVALREERGLIVAGATVIVDRGTEAARAQVPFPVHSIRRLEDLE